MMNGEEMVRTYSDMLYKVAFRYVGNQYDAEDVVSETMLAYFRKERVFESEEHRKAWLLKVTINAAKDALAGRHNDAEINEEILGGEDEWSDVNLSMDLQNALRKLPEHQREIITLFYLQNLSVNEICEVLNKKKGTVTVTLQRARENLKSIIQCQA